MSLTLARTWLPFVAAVALAISALTTIANAAQAHPLGNFTINRYSRLEIATDTVRLLYVLDMAEVPAFQEIRAIDTDRDQVIGPAEEASYLDSKVAEIRRNLSLSVDGMALQPRILEKTLTFPPGQGGLATLRVEARFDVPLGAAEQARTLAYEDRNYFDRPGWKEVVARGDVGVSIEASTVPVADQSDELRSYPGDGLSSPLDVRAATVTFVLNPGAPAPAATAERAPSIASKARSPDPLGDLLRRERLGPGVVGLALLVALGIGSFHALTPGHGKTIMAAYLVGTRGGARHAVALGATVAVSHTIGVLALGALAIYAASVLAPETVYPYLGFGTGVIVLAIGVWMLVRRISGTPGHRHEAAGTPHFHDHRHAAPPAPGSAVTWRTLLAIGLADGAIPSASALIVWLAAISIGRIELGLALVAAFGVGMAASLTAVGFLLVRGRMALESRLVTRFPPVQRLERALPWLTAVVVIGAGLFLIARAARESGLV